LNGALGVTQCKPTASVLLQVLLWFISMALGDTNVCTGPCRGPGNERGPQQYNFMFFILPKPLPNLIPNPNTSNKSYARGKSKMNTDLLYIICFHLWFLNFLCKLR
jgi:hypothetical protein